MSLLLLALIIWIAPAVIAGVGLLWFTIIAPFYNRARRSRMAAAEQRGRFLR